MAQKLIINKFGPIKSCELELSRFMTFIGPQASGKSTVIKLIYFFLVLRDETATYLMERLESGSDAVKWKELEQRLRNLFLEFWGPTIQDREMHIRFEYARDSYAEVTVEKGQQSQFFKVLLSGTIRKRIDELQVNLGKAHKVTSSNRMPLFAAPDLVAEQRRRAALVAEISAELSNIFHVHKQLLFVPAGRSLLSTIADQLANIDRRRLDYPLHKFIERINLSKAFFDRPFREIIEEQQSFQKSKLDRHSIKICRELIEKVLRAEFRQARDEGRLYFSKTNYIKISHASSGQQEAVWILLLLFLLALNSAQTIIFVEEPEAHLFPEAQKFIVDLLAFAYSGINCDLVVTTHSPYILGAVNNCVYAHMIAHTFGHADVARIVPPRLWINPKDSAGWFVDKGELTSIVDSELRFLDTSVVDSAADIINRDYERMLALVKRN